MACATLKRHLDFDSSFLPNKRARCASVLLPSTSAASFGSNNFGQSMSTARSMSMSPSPPPPSPSSTQKPDFVISKLTQEKLAAKIRDELRKTRVKKQNYQFQNVDGGMDSNNVTAAGSSEDNMHPDIPIFTFQQVNMICRKVLRDFEKELREEYDKVLSEKLNEQYEAFAKFSQDQIRRRHEAITPSYLNNKENCYCAPCVKKILLLNTTKPWPNVKNVLIKISIICGWLFVAFLLFKISQLDYEMINYDPYEILGISVGSTQSQIKKAYRKLSVILHPDKETGDEKAFMKLTKAYQALTDDEARKNWETYGNPDGPSAMSFGIALPAWIVEKKNSVWVLGLYVLVIMIALPTTVGLWWYKSMKFSSDQILLETIRMYCFFFSKAPGTSLKKVLMILAGSFEFEHRHNSEIVQRATDEKEVSTLIKQFDAFNEKNREVPLYFPYSVKARALIYAHLSRVSLNPNTLERDRQYIIEKCPYLIQEMVNCVNYLILLAYGRRIQNLPCIETMENVMKINPMVVQALWDFKSPFLQLPHITEDHLKNFSHKRKYIRSLRQLAQMRNEDRRTMLQHFSDIEYNNIMKVLSRMPSVDFDAFFEVIDDEKPHVITVGALITVTVTLKRKDMKTVFDTDANSTANQQQQPQTDNQDFKTSPQKTVTNNNVNRRVSRKQYKKNKKNKRNKGYKQNKNKVDNDSNKNNESDSEAGSGSEEDTDENVANHVNSNDHDNDVDDESASASVEEQIVTNKHNDDDDHEWEKIQQKINKKEKYLDGRSKISHTVHCPFYPAVKQEYWWVYVCDRKSRTLLTPPYHVTNLVDEEECQLRFSAPNWPGKYIFTICLRSDSYLGMDQQKNIEVDIKQAAAIPQEHPQWSFEDSDNEQSDTVAQESEYTTDEDVADE